MRTPTLLGGMAVAGSLIALGQFSEADSRRVDMTGSANPSIPAPAEGTMPAPDVIVWEISGTANWTDGTYNAFSVGTTSCNIGEAVLRWEPDNRWHPVIAQNLFRVAPGPNGHLRFEQLGQGWLKHGFCALDLNACGSCQGTGCDSLGLDCSDPYSANRNGSQGPAGPKWQVNATTGYFTYPPDSPSYSGATARRLRAPISEVQAAGNEGARYFMEGQYVHPEDAYNDGGNSANNASWREINMSSSGSMTGYIGATQQMQPAIYAWKMIDPQVEIIHVAAPFDGGNWFIGYRAYDNGNGTWDYEYAVHNLDSDRSGKGFMVRAFDDVATSNHGFRDVEYHSGDGPNGTSYDGTDWDPVQGDGWMHFQGPREFVGNGSANALRWGTTYNFRFTANKPPVMSTAKIEYFKGGLGSDTIDLSVLGPETELPPCPEDVSGDGIVGFDDILAILTGWGPCTGCPEDVNGDDTVGFDDILSVLAAWGSCP